MPAPSQPDRPIELRIREIGQLFHSLDPLPFRERDLDERVEEYIVGWARELREPDVRIVVHLPPDEAARPDAALIPDAIHNYFAYRAEVISWEVRELFRVGRSALLIGLTVLAACVISGRLLEQQLGGGYLGRFFYEGLIILGWVANWRPVEIFLYDWQPIVRRRRLYRRLARAEVQISTE